MPELIEQSKESVLFKVNPDGSGEFLTVQGEWTKTYGDVYEFKFGSAQPFITALLGGSPNNAFFRFKLAEDGNKIEISDPKSEGKTLCWLKRKTSNP